MSLPIRWSPRAVKDLSVHLDYLQKNWGEEVTANVLYRIEEVLNTISDHPALYPSFEDDEDIYRSVVTKHLVLYYRLKENNLELITFWDTRQNPENLNIE